MISRNIFQVQLDFIKYDNHLPQTQAELNSRGNAYQKSKMWCCSLLSKISWNQLLLQRDTLYTVCKKRTILYIWKIFREISLLLTMIPRICCSKLDAYWYKCSPWITYILRSCLWPIYRVFQGRLYFLNYSFWTVYSW